uniref:Uncharacterized protein n=1 Tax=Anopheles atroparvus TaxID=41427 RepID=A0AAG5DR69_ANOAO
AAAQRAASVREGEPPLHDLTGERAAHNRRRAGPRAGTVERAQFRNKQGFCVAKLGVLRLHLERLLPDVFAALAAKNGRPMRKMMEQLVATGAAEPVIQQDGQRNSMQV